MRQRVLVMSCALMSFCGAASATNGYFLDGYGMKAEGRGGTAMALSGGFSGLNNPATLVMDGNRFYAGLDLFNPERKAQRSGLGPGLDGTVDSRNKIFPLPQFAYNHLVSDDLALGVAMLGTGGLNTTYPGGQFNCGRGPANMLCGSGTLGVDLSQLTVAPTLSYRLTRNQSLGIAAQVVYQRIGIRGLQAFAATPGLSSQPDKVTNNGYDNSYGAGIRLGYFARLSPVFAVGAAYASKISMSRFKDYAGLFAGGGKFDIPENYSAGFAWNPMSPLTVSVDYERINYSDVPSVGNVSLLPAQLGSPHGPGFGWRDINVWKFGLEYATSPSWTWRAGFNHGGNPIRGSDVTFNILAPGVVTNHVTLGFTHNMGARGELTVAYMHAFNRAVQGPSILPVFMGGAPAGNEKISMYQNSIGIGYSWKL